MALVGAAHLAGPLVMVAHSDGGLILDLLVRTHPELFARMVFVDPTSEFLPSLGTPAQNAAFPRSLPEPSDPGGEWILPDAFERVAAAPPLPRVRTAVLSVSTFPHRIGSPGNHTQAQVQRANDLLAHALGATADRDTDAGHSVFLDVPQLVSDTMLGMVDEVRPETTPTR